MSDSGVDPNDPRLDIPPRNPSTRSAFKEAIRSPDRRMQLEALRDHLADELAEPRAGMAIAPISKELREVLGELATLDPPKGDARVVSLTDRIAGIKTAAGQEPQAV